MVVQVLALIPRFLDEMLEKKRASQTAQDDKDVSKAAEKYASEKVERMMDIMAQRSQGDNGGEFQSRPAEEATGAFPSVSNVRANFQGGQKSETSRAAEDLAAARVEAMMQALSSPPPQPALGEGEAEI